MSKLRKPLPAIIVCMALYIFHHVRIEKHAHVQHAQHVMPFGSGVEAEPGGTSGSDARTNIANASHVGLTKRSEKSNASYANNTGNQCFIILCVS